MTRLALRLIRWYQRTLSPSTPPRCRFTPSCSEYGAQAITYYGFWQGSARTVWRILRCQPLSKGGYDPPVPDRAPRAPIPPEPRASAR